jgi:hypothetical protein
MHKNDRFTHIATSLYHRHKMPLILRVKNESEMTLVSRKLKHALPRTWWGML